MSPPARSCRKSSQSAWGATYCGGVRVGVNTARHPTSLTHHTSKGRRAWSTTTAWAGRVNATRTQSVRRDDGIDDDTVGGGQNSWGEQQVKESCCCSFCMPCGALFACGLRWANPTWSVSILLEVEGWVFFIYPPHHRSLFRCGAPFEYRRVDQQ
jgi:hypothetical protein